MAAIHEAPKKLSLKRAFAAAKDAVDIENRIIRNAVMSQIGDAKGHGLSVNLAMLQKLLSVADPKGVKSNWQHTWETAGRHLGRFSKLSVSNNQLRGDLQLTKKELSDYLPGLQGTGTYLLNQVADDADVLMCSIVFSVAYYFQTDENGKEYKVWQYNDAGSWVSPNYEMPIYAMPSEFHSCDIVGDGAVTNSMFSNSTGATEFDSVGAQMQLIDNQIIKLQNMDKEVKEGAAPPIVGTPVAPIETGVASAETPKKTEAGLLEVIRNFFSSKPEAVKAEAAVTPVALAETPVETAQIVQLQTEKAELQQKIEAFQIKMAAMEKPQLAAVTPAQGGTVTKLSSMPASKALNDALKFGTLVTSETLETAIKEAAGSQAKGIAHEVFTNTGTLRYVNNIPKVRTKRTEVRIDAEEDLLIEYVNATNTEQSGNLKLTKRVSNVGTFKVEHTLDPESELIKAYREYLGDNGLTMDDVSIIKFLMMNSGQTAKLSKEIEAAYWNGKKLGTPVGKRTIIQRFDGIMELVKKGATVTADTPIAPVTVIPTGAMPNNGETTWYENFFRNAPSWTTDEPLAIITQSYDGLTCNYGVKYNGRSFERVDIKKTGKKGLVFHLGGDEHTVIQLPKLDTRNGLLMTPLDNLEYLFDEDYSAQTFETQKIKHEVWCAMKFKMGADIKDLKKVVCNDMFLTRS